MSEGFDIAIFYAKYAVGGLAALAGLVCGADWLVRTRRLNPFGSFARFFRTTVDPLMAPVERRVVRAGGLPTAAPWWTLAVIAVGGILLLSGLDALNGLVYGALHAVSMGAGQTILLLVVWAFALLRVALIVRVVSSFTSLSPYSKWVRWSFVLTDWILRPLRRFIPPIGSIDITPIVAWVLLWIVQGLILR